MKAKVNRKKLIIFLSFVFVILIIAIVHICFFRGAIPDYFREKTDIFIPNFAADEYIDRSSFTDSSVFCRFELNKREVEKIKKDIETNDAWHQYSDRHINLAEHMPGETDEMNIAISEIDFSNCYVVIYNYHGDEPVRSYGEIAPSFMCVTYDEVNEVYYYFDMIW